MKLPKQIPVTNYGYIDYNGKVFLIKEDKKHGNKANWQWQGTACYQMSIKGLVHYEFETKCKWFNPEWWYKKTCWLDHENLMFFEPTNKMYGMWLNNFEKLLKLCRPKSRPVEQVLKTILKEASEKTGLDIDFPYWEEIKYGVYWGEALIPVLIKNEKYYLTWENCD